MSNAFDDEGGDEGWWLGDGRDGVRALGIGVKDQRLGI